MSYTHSFDPVAFEEYKKAIEWYGERSIMALDNFILAVNKKIQDICLSPKTYRNTYKKFRESSLKKFPYAIVYFVNEETKTVIITSVYHHKRNPKRKYRK